MTLCNQTSSSEACAQCTAVSTRPLCTLTCLDCFGSCGDAIVGWNFTCTCTSMRCDLLCTCGVSEEYLMAVRVGIFCAAISALVCIITVVLGLRYYRRVRAKHSMVDAEDSAEDTAAMTAPPPYSPTEAAVQAN